MEVPIERIVEVVKYIYSDKQEEKHATGDIDLLAEDKQTTDEKVLVVEEKHAFGAVLPTTHTEGLAQHSAER